MLCPYCQREIADGTVCPCRQAAAQQPRSDGFYIDQVPQVQGFASVSPGFVPPPVQNAWNYGAPASTQQSVAVQQMTHNGLKSGVLKLVALLYTLSIVFAIISAITPHAMLPQSLRDDVSQWLTELNAEQDMYDDIMELLFTKSDSFSPVNLSSALLANIFSILLCIGLWSLLSAASAATVPPAVGLSGLRLIRGTQRVSYIFMLVGLGLMMLSGLLFVATGAGHESDAVAVGVILFFTMALAFVFVLVMLKATMRTIDSVGQGVSTGFVTQKPSTALAVLMLVGLLASVPGLFIGGLWSILSTLCTIGATVGFACCIFSYKKQLRAIGAIQ